MNLLFIKKRRYKYCVLLAFISLCSFISVSDNNSDKTFEDQCKDADAYILYSYTDISYAKSWSSFKKQTTFESKLVVNTIAGVDDYAFLKMTEDITSNLKEIEVKTLKADGTVVELDSSLVFERKSKSNKVGDINYPIPGVEPGDTIHTSFVYTDYLKEHELLGFVNLYSDIPSLNTEYTVRTNPELFVRFKTYNDFPEPRLITNDTLVYCEFKMVEIKGLKESENTCLPCELPYVYYSVEKKESELRTWKDVYNEEFNSITQPISLDYDKSSYYKRWKRRVIGEAKDSSKYYKFKILHNYIQENVVMQPPLKSEFIKSSGYFLKENHFDPFSIRRLYRQLLEDLEIEYWAVFARSKRLGEIDPYYIRKGEYDHMFFAYENGKNEMNLLYPHEEYHKYQINELPTSIYNTQAVMTKPVLNEKIKKRDKFIDRDFKLAKVDSVSIAIINIPKTSSRNNFIRQVFSSDIDINKKQNSFKCRISVSGGLSTDLRSFYSLLDQNKEVGEFYDALSEFEGKESVIQIDTITNVKLKNEKPFTYTLSGEGKLTEVLTYLNDSIISIPLSNLIDHGQIDSEDESTDLTYYLDYSYSDYYMYLLNFPCEIEILGFEENNKEFKNEYGEYFFKIKKNGSNQIKLESNLRMISDIVPKEDYKELKQINEIVQEFKNKRLLIKLKNS